jgi:hypothetical protein
MSLLFSKREREREREKDVDGLDKPGHDDASHSSVMAED